MTQRLLIGCLTALLTTAAARAAEPSAAAFPADLVVTNARVWTVNRVRPEAEALAVWNGRLVYVGDGAGVKTFTGPRTRVLDLRGRRVVPGFYDAHAHLLGGGRQLGWVSLKDCKDEAEFGRRLQEFDRKLPRDRWLQGEDWDHDRTFKGQMPTADLLEKYIPNRLAYLRRYDGHMALASRKALELAGVTADTPDPPGGVIFRKHAGKEPTGILRDNAMGLVSRHVPDPSEEEIAEAVRAALSEARRLGVTSIEDLEGSGPETRRRLFRLYQQLARSGQLTARINLRWPLAQWKQLAGLGAEADFGGDWVKIGGVKGFVDGSLGSSTAKMFEPFVHEPGSTGVYVTPPARLKELIRDADRAGLSVAVHAIGDRANAELLDIFAEVARENGPRDRRFRVEHAQHLRPEDYRRFHDLGVIPSMQPYHAIDDGRWAEGRIGPQRCASSYAFRMLLDAGARLAFGSDWPVAPLDPLPGLDAAVNRRTLDGKHPDGWFPAQRIGVGEAIEAYTLGSAYASFQEKDRGSLEVGKLADFVVLSRDVLAAEERDHIADTKVVMTVVGGKVVYEAPEGR